MTTDELMNTLNELKAQGATDADIAGVFFMLFKNDQINVDELDTLLHLVGYQLNDDFKNKTLDEQKEMFKLDNIKNV